MASYISFQLIQLDGTPAQDQRIIIRIDGKNYFGLSDAYGHTSFPVPISRGLVKVAGQSIFYGQLDMDVLRMPN
ncbi:MAG: hypothetical protein AAF399_07000 [Bacteroidota bacterium]